MITPQIQSSSSLTFGLSEIVSEIGLSQSNFTMKTCNSIENAVAVIIDGERELLIDENYLSKLNNFTNQNFYLFILAHEIGHHLNGHTLKSSDNFISRNQELEADYFAGFVLKKLNGSIEDISLTLSSLPHPKQNTGTHPILEDRLVSAKNGYNDALIKEKKILTKYESILKEKINNAIKVNTLNLARSFLHKYLETGNSLHFKTSRRYYEELINKKLFGDVPYIELSYLYKFNGNIESSTQILNEISSSNVYKDLLIYENINQLNQAIPYKLLTKLNKTEPSSIDDFSYKTILANFYLNTDKIEKSQNIFDGLYETIQETNDYEYKYGKIHFYSNYGYFLNHQSQFEKSVMISQKALDLTKSTEYLDNKFFYSVLKSCYKTYSFALLGAKKYDILDDTLKEWAKLDLTQKELNQDYLYLNARLLEEIGKPKKAIESFELYVKLNNDPFANFHLGKSYLNINNKIAACDQFKIACDGNVELGCRYLKIKCNE